MSSIRALLIENDDRDAALLFEQLAGFEGGEILLDRATTLKGGVDALRAGVFDVILLELRLPDSTGLDSLAAIRARDQHTPVIILTGLDDGETALFAARMRAIGYLLKGRYGRDELLRLIASAPRWSRFNLESPGDRDHLALIVSDRTDAFSPIVDGHDSDSPEVRALEKERALLAAAVSNSDDPVIITDSSGLMIYVNPAFERVTGYTQEEALGNNPSMLASGEHTPEFFQEMYEILNSGRSWNGQIVNRRKSGELLRMDATITSLRGDDGEIENYVMVSRDVTDYTELQRQLNQSMRLKAIGQLAAGIAHDFNNVLQAIMSYGSFLLEATREGDPTLHEYAGGVCDAAGRAANLTRQLLTFGRKQALHTEVLDISDVIEGASNLLRRLIGEDIVLLLEMEDSLPLVNVDPTQVEQIIVNLCLNSREAMPEGGEIRIATSEVYLDARFCDSNSWAYEGAFVRVTVSDTGTGMTTDVKEHIFEPFFSTKLEGKGSGMGLASAYGIVKQHRGCIHCQSEPGAGTTFSIYFPIALEEEVGEIGEPLPPAESELDTVGERILIAEDDQIVAALTRTLLEGAGYSVTVAFDGQSAFEAILAAEAPFSLVISDAVMPRTGGMELLDLVMDAPELKVKPRFLLSSGYARGKLKSANSARVSFEYLQKPFSPAELLLTVRRVLSRG